MVSNLENENFTFRLNISINAHARRSHRLVQYFLYLETNRQPLHVTQWMISDPSVLSSLLIHHVQCLENVRLIIFMTKSNYQDVGTRATPHFVGTQKRIRIHPGYASNGCRGRRKKKRSLISLWNRNHCPCHQSWHIFSVQFTSEIFNELLYPPTSSNRLHLTFHQRFSFFHATASW